MEENTSFIIVALQLLAGGLLGLVASSLTMSFGWRSADRMPGESRRPHCLYCTRPLAWQELLPLAGWVFRRNALSFPCPCGIKAGMWQQPACEIAGFLLGILAMYLHDWTWSAVPLCIGLGVLPAIALIDFFFGIIPDELNIVLGISGAAYTILYGDNFYLRLCVSGALLFLGLFFAVVYSKWRGREMLGLGDVKFFAAAGMWLHPHTAPSFLILSGAIGLLFNLGWRRISNEKEFPFAPALCLALAICVLYRLIEK